MYVPILNAASPGARACLLIRDIAGLHLGFELRRRAAASPIVGGNKRVRSGAAPVLLCGLLTAPHCNNNDHNSLLLNYWVEGIPSTLHG